MNVQNDNQGGAGGEAPALQPTTAQLKSLIDQALEGNRAAGDRLEKLEKEFPGLRTRLEELAPKTPPVVPPNPAALEPKPKSKGFKLFWW